MIDAPFIDTFEQRIYRLIDDLQESKEGRRMLLKLLFGDRRDPELPDFTADAE